MAEAKNFGIVLDDGFERVSIGNKYGEEVGVFYFNPTDIGIIERYNKLVAGFDKITEPLTEGSSEDMTEEERDKFAEEQIKEASKRLYEACNELFGGDFASAFFGRTNPFSPVNGRFYCEVALEGVGKYIESRFDSEVKKITTRVQKYTNRAQRRRK